MHVKPSTLQERKRKLPRIDPLPHLQRFSFCGIRKRTAFPSSVSISSRRASSVLKPLPLAVESD
jgi:hypothetical protein